MEFVPDAKLTFMLMGLLKDNSVDKQDNISWLIEYTKPQMPVLAKRNTNLFSLHLFVKIFQTFHMWKD